MQQNREGVNFFQHFPRNFLRPYGVATQSTSLKSENMKMILKSFNCEWLNRPGVAISELRSSLVENWSRIEKNMVYLVNNDVMTEFNDFVEELISLTTSARTNVEPTSTNTDTPQDTKRQLKKLAKRLETWEDIIASYSELSILVGGSLFQIGIQLQVAHFVFNNLQFVAENCRSTPELDEFKKEATRDAYLNAASNFLIQRSMKSQPTTTVHLKDVIAKMNKKTLSCLDGDDMPPSPVRNTLVNCYNPEMPPLKRRRKERSSKKKDDELSPSSSHNTLVTCHTPQKASTSPPPIATPVKCRRKERSNKKKDDEPSPSTSHNTLVNCHTPEKASPLPLPTATPVKCHSRERRGDKSGDQLSHKCATAKKRLVFT